MFLLKSAVCAAVMAGIVFVIDMFVPAQGGKLIQLAIISVKGIVAVVIFFAMAVILRMKEATYWIERFKRLIKKFSSSKARK